MCQAEEIRHFCDFNFGFMKSYTQILDELEQIPSVISELTHGLSREQWRWAPEGKWSTAINAGHLLTIESLWIGRLDNFVLGNEVLRAWNGTNNDTVDARFNEQNPKAIMEDFESIRSVHVKLLRKYEGKENELQARHPVTNAVVSLHRHVEVMLEHDHQHINTIKGLIEAMS